MKKILVLGDVSQVRWHPLSNMNPLLEVLRGQYELTVTEKYPEITKEQIKTFDICINYIDNWEDRGNEEAENVLLWFVENGGKLLTIHNGIITKKAPQSLAMQGGTFTGHDAYGKLEYRIFLENVPFDIKTTSFSLEEEPYQFKRFREEEQKVFLEYEYQGKWHPAGWQLPYGKGTVVYFCPGHDEKTFSHPVVTELVKQILESMSD